RARVPGPIASIRKASSPGGARQRLIGRGRRRPGASSMKNWPGTPGSRRPRRTRRSVYGPTCSEPVTLACSGRIDPLLEADGDLRLRVRDRLDRGGRARDRRDAGNPSDEGGLADAVTVRPGTGALRRVHDEIDAAAPDQIDDARPLAGL